MVLEVSAAPFTQGPKARSKPPKVKPACSTWRPDCSSSGQIRTKRKTRDFCQQFIIAQDVAPPRPRMQGTPHAPRLHSIPTCVRAVQVHQVHPYPRRVRATAVIFLAEQAKAQWREQMPLHPSGLQQVDQTLEFQTEQARHGTVCCVANMSVVVLPSGRQ